MRKFELGCVGVPRGDGSYFTTVYDVEGHGQFTVVWQFHGLARAVFNFSSEEEAKIESKGMVEALNNYFSSK